MKKYFSRIFLFAKDYLYRTMTSVRQGAAHFTRYGQELVSKPKIELKKGWGGYLLWVLSVWVTGQGQGVAY